MTVTSLKNSDDIIRLFHEVELSMTHVILLPSFGFRLTWNRGIVAMGHFAQFK